MRPSSSRTLPDRCHTPLPCREIARRKRFHILLHTRTFTRPSDGVVTNGTTRKRRPCGLRVCRRGTLSPSEVRAEHTCGEMKPPVWIALRGSQQTPIHNIAAVMMAQCARGTRSKHTCVRRDAAHRSVRALGAVEDRHDHPRGARAIRARRMQPTLTLPAVSSSLCP
jgi:hypothetical protein